MLFSLAASGALTVLLTRAREARTVMLSGTVALAVGVALTLLALTERSLALFFVGTVITGAGFGLGFQGAVRTVLPLAAPDERAGVLSTLYVVAYLAMGVPAVFAGVRVVHGGGVLATAHEYGLAVIALAVLAMVGMLLRRPAGAPAATLLRSTLPLRR